MAINTHKPGYSTSEVAQVFGCSITHVHQLIEDKKLGAMITESNKPNGRRTIRIGREHIQQYMRENPKRFSTNEMRTWGVVSATEAPETTPTEKPKPVLMPRPTGAWAHLIDANGNPVEPAGEHKRAEKGFGEKEVRVPKTPIESPTNVQTAIPVATTPAVEGPITYSVLVNGKVSVCGITKETAVTIVQALLNDTGTGEFTAIAILKNYPKGGAR